MARILLLAPSYPPRVGGLERQLAETHKLLRLDGHDVDVLTFRDVPAVHEEAAGVWVVPAVFRVGDSFPVPRRRRDVFDVVRRGHYDVVLTNTRFFLVSWLAARAARRLGIPYIHVEHGADFLRGRSLPVDTLARAWDETVGRWTLHHAAAVVGVSDAATAFARRLGAPAAKTTTVANWLPFASAQAVHARSARLRATGFPDDPRLLFVGRMVGNKGIWELLEGFAQVAADRPRLRLRLVGDGPEREALARRADALGLAGVEVLGRISEADRQAELAAADLSMQPSRGEGFGLSLMEAVAAGVPVVASRCDAYIELLDAGRLGLLHDVGDATGLASALRQALGDPMGCADRAQQAHRELAARHSEEHARASWRRVLDGVGVPAPTPPQGKRK